MLRPRETSSSDIAQSRWFSDIWLPVLILAAIFALRSYLTYAVNLVPDECSYWAWSRRLDWSYFDNSGMVAYLIRASTEAFGFNSPLSVRFPFLLLSLFTTYLLYRVSFLLFHTRSYALYSAVVFNITPVSILGGCAAIHDNALIFFWMLGLWATSRFLRSGNNDWFYVMGVAAGLAMQSKYTGVLMLPCIFLFLVFNRAYRNRLLCREPWIGVLVAIAFVLPIILWNVEHDWASISHILFIGSGSASMFRRITDGLGYHAAQCALVSPLIYVGLVVALGSSIYGNVRTPRSAQILLLCFGLPLLVFGVLAFVGHVEANWAFMGYGSIVILAVEMFFRKQAEGPRGIWRWLGRKFRIWAVILAVGPTALVLLHGWVGLLPASVEKSLGKADRVIWETRGWEGLGRHVASLKSPGDVLAADSYQLCALLEFNVPGNPRVRYLAPWNRPTQFDVWEPSFDNLKGQNILLVSPRRLEPSNPSFTTVFENFSRVEELPPYQVMYHGVAIRKVYLYRGYNFDPFSPRRLGPRSLFYSDY